MGKKKKKKKKAIAKQRTKAKKKRQKTAKKKQEQKRQANRERIQYVDTPAISEMRPPNGFRAVSISQAMIEYANPVMEYVEKGVVKDINKAMGIVTEMWNFQISDDTGDLPRVDKKGLIKKIRRTLKMNAEEAASFLDMMLERKKHLLPDEIQPKGNLSRMYIRKDMSVLIAPFNYDSLNISDQDYTPEEADKEMVASLEEMDRYIAERKDYDVWESHFLEMADLVEERFFNWLEFKGVAEYGDDFTFNINVYLNFIYRYGHDEPITLKTVKLVYLQEFFADHVLRKATVEPHRYPTWPPAMKMFYRFLEDVGYMDDAGQPIAKIDEMEPIFIEILRKMYS